MCAIDGAEPYEMYRRVARRARRAYRCDECGRPIVAGEGYWAASGLCDGHWNSHRTCAHCAVGEAWLIAQCGGFLHGGVGEDIIEHADEYREFQRPLNRLVVGMRRGWRRFDSAGLMPVPRLPPLHGPGVAA